MPQKVNGPLWAFLQITMHVLQSLGNLTGDPAVLRQAEAAYRAAMEEWTRECASMDWAAVQNNLGVVLVHFGDLTATPPRCAKPRRPSVPHWKNYA